MSFNADIVIGALLVGTWANSVLYTVEVIQAAHYYRHFKHDNWMLKLLVLSAIAIDSVSMSANYASVYLYTITHWGVPFHLIYHYRLPSSPPPGDLAYLQNQYWASHFDLIGRSIIEHISSNSLTRSTSLQLVWWPLWPKVSWLVGTGFLTRNKFITLTLFIFITVATGGAFACGVTIAMFPEYTNRRKVIIPATTWLITEAVTDISIASALLWEFRKARSSFKETRSLLNRLVARTIQTGTAGASIALAVLVAFLANKESNVPTGIAYTLGHVYCITMGGGTSSGGNLETRGERGNQGRSEGGDEYGCIHVHRTAVVHIDTPQEFLKNPSKSNPGQDLLDDSPSVDIEMTANDSASYSSKKQQDL
ncbi:hypothetical protein B0H14DRAFT_3522435 [Mycena olivaceomarginata]|nr:hypothetical protein B0H14DRAFT_3522435 [Mycena olivaceomarginata]